MRSKARAIPEYKVQLVRAGSVAVPSRLYRSAEDAVEIFRQQLGDPDREHFAAVYLDNQGSFLGFHVVAIGTVNLLNATAREVFRVGVHCGAVSVVLLHNHPSGHAEPSPHDIVLTRELEVVGMALGIGVIDHVVVGSEACVSLRETNRMLIPPSDTPDLSEEDVDERMRLLLGIPRTGYRGSETATEGSK